MESPFEGGLGLHFGIIIAFSAVMFLAFSNGANDNFKGVATLLGSRTAGFRTALNWATLTTLAGSIAATILAQKLLVSFSGKGLVPDTALAIPFFPVAVALAAATTVFLATRFGFPISTTHALVGSLIGAGAWAGPDAINLSRLYSSFLLPLLVSPGISLGVAVVLYPIFRFVRIKLGVNRETCLCIGNEVIATAPAGMMRGESAAVLELPSFPQVRLGTQVSCQDRYVGHFLGINAKVVLDLAHFLSSGLVSFARGLNDTPKIAAILLTAQVVGGVPSVAVVALAMAIGGWVYSKPIAQTMSYNITAFNDGQGFTANLVTSLVVIGASAIGLPVSTTHVSCGALFGIGSVTRQADWGMIGKIVLAWVITLPLGALFGLMFFQLRNIF